LLRHPDQLERLRSDLSLIPSAIEEILRWDSPVQLDGRTAMEPASIGGIEIAEGNRVVTLLGGANHDPSHWTDPGNFDITRDEGPPMSFASGVHYCLGANLSRAEGQAVFAEMLQRFDKIEPAGEFVNRPRLTLRGFESVPIRVETR